MAWLGLFWIAFLAHPLEGCAGEVVVEPPRIDLGTVKEGERPKALFIVRNLGRQPVEVTRIATSCGCTSAILDDRIIPSGGFVTLKVSMDTTSKEGDVKKWIRLETSRGDVVTAWLEATVHPSLRTEQKKRASLFQEPCAQCHAQPAKGLSEGAAIYRAVCAMCHGKAGQGASAPPIRFREGTRQTIAEGKGKMPGFASSVGGPLSQTQIEALVQWLHDLDVEAGNGYKSVNSR